MLDNDLSVLIKTILKMPDIKDIKKLNEEIQSNIKAIQIKIDPNVLSTLNKFSDQMKNIATSVGIVNDKLAKQTDYIKDQNGEWQKRTRLFKDDGIHETLSKVSAKQAELLNATKAGTASFQQQSQAIIQQTKNIEAQTASYGRLVKTVKDLNLQGQVALKRNYFEDAKGTKTTTFTDINGNETRGAKITNKIDLTPSQQQAKNLKDAITASNKLFAIKQKLVGLDDTDIEKQNALNKQATLYYNRLQNILNSRKVIVDGNNIGSLSKDGIKQFENLQKENTLKLDTVQSGFSDKSNKEMENAFIATEERKRSEIAKTDEAQRKASNKAIDDNYTANQKRIADVEEWKIKSISAIDTITAKNKGLLTESSLNNLTNQKNNILGIDAKDKSVGVEQLKEYDIELQKVINDTKLLANEQARLNKLGMNIVGDSNHQIFSESNSSLLNNVFNANSTKEIANAKNKLQEFLQTTSEAGSKISKLKVSTDSAGNSMIHYVEQIKTGKDTFESYNRTIDLSSKTIRDNGSTTRNELTRNLSMWDQFKIAMERIPIWMGAMTLFYGSLRQLQEGVTFLNDLNKSMTNIGMITGQSHTNIIAMTQDYIKLAETLHDTVSSVQQASEEFLRAGNNQAETLALLKSSTVMSKIAGQDQKSTADQLIAITNAFKLNAEETMMVVDKLTAVDNASATSTKELGLAIERTASSAQLAGTSFDELVSYIATVSSVSRKSASSIGESFKVGGIAA